jgi:IS5 family transposase
VKREEHLELLVNWHIAIRLCKHRALPGMLPGELLEKVEHPFHVMKNLFRHRSYTTAI